MSTCLATPPRSVSPNAQLVFVSMPRIGNDRRDLDAALRRAGLTSTPLPSPCTPDAVPDGALVIVDSRTAAPPKELCGHASVAVLARAPEPSERLRLLAGGCRWVLDLDQPVDQLAEDFLTAARAAADDAPRTEPHLDDVISRSASMRELVAEARRLADVDATVLITGETGVGKEHLARAVHALGPRADKPFVTVNCGALPESLLESQLLGHERGAFTGADRVQRGFFENADGGTLLLDEIGEMPTHLQVKLLTVLESRQVVRLGGRKPIPVDVRVMAATNRDIAAEVRSGAFREDLYFRLNVIRLDVPPLRERVEDLPDLAGRVLFELRDSAGSAPGFEGMTDRALRALTSYAWPGNVRELRNVLERCLVFGTKGKIDVDELPEEVRFGRSQSWRQWSGGAAPAEWDDLPLREVREAAIAEVETAYLRRVLEQTGGRIDKTAERAGLRPRSLYDKMRRYGLAKEDFKPDRRKR